MLTDTHTHLYLEEFQADLPALVQRAQSVGVNKFLLPNVDVATVPTLKQTVADFPGLMHGMIGLHPCSVQAHWRKDLDLLEAELRANPQAWLAIGEIGIDLHWDASTLGWQQEALHHQIDWALEWDKPVVIHARKSFDELFEILEARQNGALRGVFHCFTGNEDQAQRALDLGFYLGIGGVVTFKNGGLDAFLGRIPLERILLETDAPYLAPAPHRGQRNLPEYLALVAEKVAALYGTSVATVAQHTTLNAQKLFAWPA